jgi:hypothetical protein
MLLLKNNLPIFIKTNQMKKNLFVEAIKPESWADDSEHDSFIVVLRSWVRDHDEWMTFSCLFHTIKTSTKCCVTTAATTKSLCLKSLRRNENHRTT